MHPKKLASFFFNNATPDFFTRSSGNTLDAEEFKQMISSDIIQEKQR